jgi:hypothetical protein
VILEMSYMPIVIVDYRCPRPAIAGPLGLVLHPSAKRLAIRQAVRLWFHSQRLPLERKAVRRLVKAAIKQMALAK